MTHFLRGIGLAMLKLCIGICLLCGGAIWAGETLPASPTIVYMYQARDTRSWDLMMMDLWHGATIRLTQTPQVNERYPVWSPDGTAIAYHANGTVGGIFEIFVRPAYPTRALPRQVFSPEANLGDIAITFDRAMPAWSPDGRQLGFHAKTNTGRYGIFTGYVDGSQMRLVNIPPESGDALHFAWSPDGTHIAFSEFRTDGRYLYYLPLDTQNIETATTNRARMKQITDNGFFPSWSPDGTQLVYVAINLDLGIGNRLMHYDLQTQIITPLLPNLGSDDTHPHWSSDGQFILFASNRVKDYDLYLLHIETGHLQRLTFRIEPELSPHWYSYSGG